MRRATTIIFRNSLLALAILLCFNRTVQAASREYLVKGAFLYNFTQFIEWPPEAFPGDDAPFVIAVIGADPFQGTLEQIMADKIVGKRSIVIRHFGLDGDFGRCQMMFLPAALDDDKVRAALRKIGNAPILTVGETDSMLSAGGAIGLFLEDGRVRFQINPDALDAAKLKASAKLMKLARIYKK